MQNPKHSHLIGISVIARLYLCSSYAPQWVNI